MSQVIIYKNDGGGFVIVYPTPEALEMFGLEFIAKKDVPAGKPYKIIEASELPEGDQEEWAIDEADLTDGIGAQFGAGTSDAVAGYDLENGIVVTRNEVSGELKAYNINTQQFMEVVE
jgi:hypothetical protein